MQRLGSHSVSFYVRDTIKGDFQGFLERCLILHQDNNINSSIFVINLILLWAKCHIHKCSEQKTALPYFHDGNNYMTLSDFPLIMKQLEHYCYSLNQICKRMLDAKGRRNFLSCLPDTSRFPSSVLKF